LKVFNEALIYERRWKTMVVEGRRGGEDGVRNRGGLEGYL